MKSTSDVFLSHSNNTGKRFFLGLMCGAALLLCLCIVLFWLIPYVGFSAIHASLPYLLGAISLALIVAILWMCVALSYHVYTGKPTFGIKRIRGLTIKFMFPLMELLGRMLHIPRERIRLSFVKVNNEIVLGSLTKYDANKVLLLLPHCIQNSQCAHRLTYSVDNCQRCGRCRVHDLLELRDEWGFHMVIATGGTIARRVVKQLRPRVILAVACERDLASGIQDTYPIPVFGVINERPHGPCLNTHVDVTLVSAALQCFVNDPTENQQKSCQK